MVKLAVLNDDIRAPGRVDPHHGAGVVQTKETKSLLSGLRTWWFALAFTSIGLETRF